MLEAPDLSADALIACLGAAYGLPMAHVTFLPLGADQDTAVYRADAADGATYFCKLRRGELFAPSVTVPHWLHAQGSAHVIAPYATHDGALWTRLEPFTVMVSPFVEGRDAVDAPLSARQMVEFGAATRQLHDAQLPAVLRQGIPRETYDPYWCDRVRMFQTIVSERTFTEPFAAQTADLFQAHKVEIDHCVARAESLAETLARQSPASVLCHSDLHAWNILATVEGAFYIVDWDNLIYAPRERDLMFIGAGHPVWNTPSEIAAFYEGYGPTPINRAALAYYRYDRIVQDIEAYAEALLLTNEGGADRPVMFEELASNFAPGGVLEAARATEVTTSDRS